MQTPVPPVIAYAAGYDDHGADTDYPEMELWRAVLRQAGDDLLNPNERIRADAIAFFESDPLLLIMDLAGIDPDLAPVLRAKAKDLAEALPESRQPNARRISYRGQTHSLTEWAKPHRRQVKG